LARDDCTLEQLLEENDLVTELQFNNFKLQGFLDHDKLLKLVEYITEMPTEEDDEKRKYKFPFMACEVFNSENANILDKFVTPY
jgi:serine/threonine-protein phosphatase 6 regulatory subunit 3